MNVRASLLSSIFNLDDTCGGHARVCVFDSGLICKLKARRERTVRLRRRMPEGGDRGSFYRYLSHSRIDARDVFM